MKKRVFCLFLCLVMCLSLLPAAAFAEGGPAEDIAVEEEIVTEEPLEEEALVEEPPAFAAAQESTDSLVVEEAEAEPRCEDAVLVSCEESVAVSDPGALDADALLQGYFEQLLGLKPPVNGDLRGPLDPTQGMTPQQAYLFGRLLDYVRATAAGEPRPNLTVYPIKPDEAHSMTWTLADLAELGIDEINSENADTAVGFIMENFLSADVILQALLNACPFELYWFDKTVGIRFSFRYAFTPESITFGGLSYTFAVAEAYSDGVTFDEEGIPICLKEGIGTSITAAANNARAIVDSCTAEDDAARITSYVDAICSLTGYNQKAVDENWPYGNPWQVIWVFDGDPGTDVVCEGYAKAFQYLCDLARSSGLFISSIVNCLCVSGVMNTEGVSENKDHMWNLVTMEDGKNYLVDVTNCDSGSNLILKGYKWSYSRRKYTVENITYEYDDKTVSYYTPEELDLSNTDYSPIQPGKWVSARPALNLHDTIGVRFYVSHAKTVDPRTIKVNVRYTSRYQDVNRNFFLAEMTPNQDGEYFIEAVDAASDEMSDPVTLRIFLGDRLVWLEDYTIASIAESWLTDGEHGRYDTLLRALLQYGWKAQVQFDNHADPAHNITPENPPALRPIPDDFAPGEDPATLAGYTESVQFGINLETAVGMNIYIKPKGGLGLGDFTVSVTDKDKKTVPTKAPVMSGGRIKVTIPGLFPEQLLDDYTITVSVKGVSAQYVRSAMGCAYVVEHRAGTPAALVQLLQALYQYSLAAKGVF